MNPDCWLVVATTHLLFNPRRQDVRLAQIQVLLSEIDRLSFICYNAAGRLVSAPAILTGDFNLQPNTAPYQLITEGKLWYERLSKHWLDQCNEGAEIARNGKELLPASLGITDACQHYENLDTGYGPLPKTQVCKI